MKNHKNPLLALLFLVLPLLLPATAQAEQFQDFGDYVVHFNALPTSFLDPAVAKNYRIVRSKNRAMLNITVLKKVMGTAGSPVRATVTASAKNLSTRTILALCAGCAATVLANTSVGSRSRSPRP